MGDGRVIDLRPKSLKRIHYYGTNGKKENYKERRDLINNNSQKEGVESQMVDTNSTNEATDNILIENNNNHDLSIIFKNKSNQTIPHIDGTLMDYETGELRYFIAIESIVGKEIFEKIVEGSKVTFSDKPRGVCEVILHKRNESNQIFGDIDLSDEFVAIEFVEVETITEYLEEAKFKPKPFLE